MRQHSSFRRVIIGLVAVLNAAAPLLSMPAQLSAQVAPSYEGDYAARVTITQPSTADMQLYQPGMTLAADTQYRVTFLAYSNTGRDMSVHVHQHSSPFTDYGLGTHYVDLTTSWQEFTTTFTTIPAPDGGSVLTGARIRFFLQPYAQPGDVYWIDNVRLVEVAGSPNDVSNPSFESGESPWVFYHSSGEPTGGSFDVVRVSPTQCSDGADNDGDGTVDLADPGCDNATDDDETNVFVPGAPAGLRNPGFESGAADWAFYTSGRAGFSASSPAFAGNQSGKISVTLEGSESQLYQGGLSLTSGSSYRITFAGRSTTSRDVSVVVEQDSSPYTNYGLQAYRVDLTSQWRTHTIDFVASGFSGTVNNAKLKFWFAPHAVQGDIYYFDEVTFDGAAGPISGQDTQGPVISIQVQDSQEQELTTAALPKFEAAIPPIAPSRLADVWAVDDGERVKQDDLNHWAKGSPQNRVWDGNRVSIFGGKNEIVAFQLQLQAGANGASNMDVRLPSLTNGSYTIQNTSTDPTQYVGRNIEIFLEHYYDTTNLGRSHFTNQGAGGEGVCEAAPFPDSAYMGLIPDMLVPIEAPPGQKAHGQGGAPFQIAGSRNQGIWFDVYVPKDAPAGTYTGNIEVLESGIVTYRIPVSFQVYNFTLPDENHLHTFFLYPATLLERHPGISEGTAAYWQLLHKYMNLAHRHRMDFISNDSFADFSANIGGYYRDGSGSYFTAAYGYDGPGIGVGQTTYSIGTYDQPVTHTGVGPTCDWSQYSSYSRAGFGPRNQSTWEQASNQWEQWFRDNAPDVVRFKYMGDEPDRDANSCDLLDAIEKAGWIHNNSGVGRNLMTFQTGWFNGHMVNNNSIDIFSETGLADLYWGYHLYEYSPGEFHGNAQRIQSQDTVAVPGRKKMTGIYNGYLPDYGNDELDMPVVDMRSIPWVSYKYNVDQYFLWEVAFYTEADTDPTRRHTNIWEQISWAGYLEDGSLYPDPVQRFPGGDGHHMNSGRDDMYPADDRGVDGPIASMRMKNFRRGMQDYEYLWLAEQGNRDVQAILNGVVPAAFDDITPAVSYTAPFNAPYGDHTGNQWYTEECRKNYGDWRGQTIQYTDHRRPPTWPQTGYGFENARIQLAALLDGSVPPPPPPVAQCGDGIDNDGDGAIDMADPGCANTADNDETNGVTPPPPPPAEGEASLNITQVTDNMQLYQSGISLTSGQQYRLTFDAYSSTGHDVSVSVHQHGSPYTDYGLNGFEANLGTSYQTFTTTFTASGFTGTVTDARVRFWLTPYAQLGDVYHFDNIRLEPVSGGANLLQNGTFDSGLSPWVFHNQGSEEPPQSALDLYITFTVTATDPSGVADIQLFVNGTMVRQCLSSPCSYTAGPNRAGTALTYYATATDNSSRHNQSRYPATGQLTHVVGGGAIADTVPPVVSVTHEITGGGGGTTAQCADGADNDGDGLVDMADPGCTSSTDTSEVNTVPGPGGTARGRARIVNNNLVADNGYPLRGEHMFVTDWNMARIRGDQMWLELRDTYHLNTVRLAAYQPPIACSPGECKELGEILPLLDEAVAQAARFGMYAIIDPYHAYVGFDQQRAMDWWTAIAPRYANSTHVIYEAVNEPIFNPYDATVDDIQFQEDVYQLIRILAPQTPIILWTPNRITYNDLSGGADAMTAMVQRASGIDYSNAAVGWHGYPNPDALSRIDIPIHTRQFYPSIMTEIMITEYNILGSEYDENIMRWNRDIARMEANNFSWVLLGAYPHYPTNTNYIQNINITWPADPGATGASTVAANSSSPAAVHLAVELSQCTHFLSQTGSDSNNGTSSASPWRTIAYANQQLQPGNTLCIGAGTYHEVIQPVRSGTAGNPITYARMPGLAKDSVIVDGTGTSELTAILGQSYITLDGLTLKSRFPGIAPRYVVYIIESWGSHNTLRDLHVYQDGDVVQNRWNGPHNRGFVSYGQYNTVENSEFDHLDMGVHIGGNPPRYTKVIGNHIHDIMWNSIDVGDPGTGASGIQGVLIENNFLDGTLGEDGIQFEPDYNHTPEGEGASDTNRGVIIRNNVFANNSENAIDMKGASNIVIEGNIIYGVDGDNDGSYEPANDRSHCDVPGAPPAPCNDRQGGWAIMRGSRTANHDFIVRRNVFYDNYSGVDTCCGPNLHYNATIYNNTFVANNHDYTGSNSTYVNNAGDAPFYAVGAYGNTGLVVKNNIIAEHFGGEVFLNTLNADLRTADINSNLYYNSNGVRFADPGGNPSPWPRFTFQQWQQRLQSAGIPGGDAQSQVGNPLFVNVPARPVGSHTQFDFSLQSGSPAINAGEPLTRSVSAGSGTSLRVANANYFMDGFGVTSGDEIQIASNGNKAIITGIDYGSNTLTLDRSISWGQNDGVSLAYAGSAPDIGAYEYGGGGPSLPTHCSDGADNDGDGLTDMADPGCSSSSDTSETDTTPPPPADGIYATFTVTAADAGGITNITIYVNNSQVRTCTTSPCTYSGGPYADAATTTYYATAKDTAGNQGRDPSSGQKTLAGTIVGASAGTPMTQAQYDAFVDSQEDLLSTADSGLVDRVSGYILLQVQSRGEAWYLDPVSRLRYYLPNGDYAFEALRTFGLGITNADIAQIPIGFVPGAGGTDSDLDTVPDRVETAIGTDPLSADSDSDGYSDNVEIASGYDPLGPNRLTFNQTLVNQVKGRILLQVQAHGEAWYLYPADGKRYYMADGADAYQVMRYLSLGISNADLSHIPIGRLTLGDTGDSGGTGDTTDPDGPLNPAAQCGDGADNDGDGLIDMGDPGCSGPTDNDETNAASPPPPQTAACTHYVDPSGNDTNAGTNISSAWRTLAHANSAAQPGNVICLRTGTYSESINPVRSGTASAPITYQSYNSEPVTLTGSPSISMTGGISYVVVNGIRTLSTKAVQLTDASWVTIRNSRLVGVPGSATWAFFEVDNTSYSTIKDNFVDRADGNPANILGDGIILSGNSNHNLIEGNTVTGTSHVAMSSSYGGQHHNVFRNNLAYDNHTDYSLQNGVDRSLFEGNVGYYPAQHLQQESGHTLQATPTNSIFRCNVLYDDTKGPASQTHPREQVVSFYAVEEWNSTYTVKNNRTYHNVFYGANTETYPKSTLRVSNWSSLDKFAVERNVFKNNVIAAGTDYQVLEDCLQCSANNMSSFYDGNIVRKVAAGEVVASHSWVGTYTLSQAMSQHSTVWGQANKESDPMFVNTAGVGPAKDFHLRSGSPAIDAGVALTTTSSASSNSTTLQVTDASYFMDGWGVPGVSGDLIRIGGGQAVRITAVNYSTNTITLESPRTWSAGARVDLDYQGSAPDIGAYEYGDASTAATGGSTDGEHPNVFISAGEVAAIRQRVNTTTEPWYSAYAAMITKANQALNQAEFSVTDNGGGLSHGASYFATDNPYTTDGVFNPSADRLDYERAEDVSGAVRDLGLAYAFTGDSRYADKSIRLIRRWAIDPATRMTPEAINQGPVTTGQRSGNAIEIFVTIPALIYGADLIWDYSGWSASDKTAFQTWVADLGRSAQGLSPLSNNIEGWRLALVASAGAFAGDSNLMTYAWGQWRTALAAQMDSQGRFTEELTRTNSLSYSLYALQAFTLVAETARHQGQDLYGYQSSSGRSLKLAFDYHAPYTANPASWPYQQITALVEGEDVSVYEFGYSQWQEPSYLQAIQYWGRPLTNYYVLQHASLTHANRFDLL